MNRFFISLLLMLSVPITLAQSPDVGLVNLVSGDVTYTSTSGGPGKVQAFMKVREGDRLVVPAGGQLRVVFFDGSRQERWTGPASFRASKTGSEPISGKAAEIATLPAGASQRVAQVPQLVQIAKLGGIQVRGMTRTQKASVEQQTTVSEARAVYEKMRNELPADDITPELYLYAVLHDYLLYSDMKTVAEEMLRKQPGNNEVNQLLAWVNSRLAR